MSTKNDKHPGLVVVPGSAASLGISWNPPTAEELTRKAIELGVYKNLPYPPNPPTAAAMKAAEMAEQRLREMQERLSAPPMVYVDPVDPAVDAFIYATTGPDGTINKRRITRKELENEFPSNFGKALGPVGTKPWSNYDKLRMRLGLIQGDQFGCHINIYEGPNSVFVFVATDDKALILEDAVSLFPSDSLIGQFRLWQESIK